jgi:predicted glycosyltransferase
MNKTNKQIKSKERVSQHGEVYTSEREVNNMLDLVKNETERLDSRFLEPACGDGNFLINILERKMNILVSRYKKQQHEFEKYSIVVISSIYGIDILKDNIDERKKRIGDGSCQ